MSKRTYPPNRISTITPILRMRTFQVAEAIARAEVFEYSLTGTARQNSTELKANIAKQRILGHADSIRPEPTGADNRQINVNVRVVGDRA